MIASKRLLASLGAVAWAAALGCASAPPEPVTEAPGPLAYEIEAPHGGARALLFGSVHVARPGDWTLPERVVRALEQAEVLVLEIDLSETSQAEVTELMLSLGEMPPGQRLRSVVSAETWALLERRAAETGLPLSRIDSLKPWVVALHFVGLSLASAGFDAEHGVERGLLQADPGIPIRGLETAFEQLSIFDDLPYPVQDRMLREALAPDEDRSEDLDALLAAWKVGDADAIEAILFENRSDPQLARFYEETYDLRNLRMAESLEEILAEGRRAFVVVGAGHLVGRRGLPQVLKQAGFRVRQVSGQR